VVVQLARHSDGVRRMISMAEITGMESGIISLQEVFTFDRVGLTDDGKIIGDFRATGVRPRFADRCRLFGTPIPDEIFSPTPRR
jgi:pilus assembly protein CpaF